MNSIPVKFSAFLVTLIICTSGLVAMKDSPPRLSLDVQEMLATLPPTPRPRPDSCSCATIPLSVGQKRDETEHRCPPTQKELHFKALSIDEKLDEAVKGALSFSPYKVSQESVEKCGKLAVGATGLLVTLDGHYIAGPAVIAAATCAFFPQEVANGIEKAQPYIQKVSQHINKKNCGRAMQRCPNACQKFASLITFGYYKPEEHAKSGKKSH